MRRVGTILGLVMALTMAMAPVAVADSPEQSGVVDRAPRVSAWLGQGDGIFEVTGPPLAEGCLSFPELDLPEYPATIVTTPTGDTLTTIIHTQQVSVYDDEGFDDVFEWLVQKCLGVLGGQPAPEPLATGEGHVKVRSRVDVEGVEHGSVSVTARLTTADGESVHLNSHGRIGAANDFVNYGG